MIIKACINNGKLIEIDPEMNDLIGLLKIKRNVHINKKILE